MPLISWIKRQITQLKHQAVILYYAIRDPRTPVLIRCLAMAVVAYALSPIDLIPDFIPLLGYLDDLVLVGLGLALVRHFISDELMLAATNKAQTALKKPISYTAAAVVISIWLIMFYLLGAVLWM